MLSIDVADARRGLGAPALTDMTAVSWDRLTTPRWASLPCQREVGLRIARGGPLPAGPPAATRQH